VECPWRVSTASPEKTGRWREDYVYLLPFPPSPASLPGGLRRDLAVALCAEADVEDEHTVFLKTIIPSRKATKEPAHTGAEQRHRRIRVDGAADRPPCAATRPSAVRRAQCRTVPSRQVPSAPARHRPSRSAICGRWGTAARTLPRAPIRWTTCTASSLPLMTKPMLCASCT
jgi:hypothetical protein